MSELLSIVLLGIVGSALVSALGGVLTYLFEWLKERKNHKHKQKGEPR